MFILEPNEHSIVVHMTKSLVKPTNKKTIRLMSRQQGKFTVPDMHMRDHIEETELKCNN